MSTELATTHTSVAPTQQADPSDAALNRILKQARAMDAAHKLGSALSSTGMVPDIYRGKPDDATAAILYGAELGLSAIQSLQNIFIVRGKPAIYSRTMVAQVIAAGHFVYEESATADTVTWKGRRGDSGIEFTSTWSMDRAKAAGFTSNKLYQTLPLEMLRAKAQAEVCRTMAPDVLLGMAHSREELELEPSPRFVTSQTATTDDLRAQLAGPQDDAPDDDAITKPQLTKLSVLFKEQGFAADAEGKAARLAWVSSAINRDVASATELTKDEASHLIELMSNDADETA